MRATAFFEIFQNAAIELDDLFKATAFHERTGFLTANAAGAEHYDGLLFKFRWQFFDGLREIAKMIDANRQRIFERAELHFVIVTGVEQRHRTTFIEPALEFLRFEFW